MVARSPGWLSLVGRHVRHALAADRQLVGLDILADLDEAVVEELQCTGRLESEHLR